MCETKSGRSGGMSVVVASRDSVGLMLALEEVGGVCSMAVDGGIDPVGWAGRIVCKCKYPTFVEMDLLWVPRNRVVMHFAGGMGRRLESISGCSLDDFRVLPLPRPLDPSHYTAISSYVTVDWSYSYDYVNKNLAAEMWGLKHHARHPDYEYPIKDLNMSWMLPESEATLICK